MWSDHPAHKIKPKRQAAACTSSQRELSDPSGSWRDNLCSTLQRLKVELIWCNCRAGRE